MRLARYRRLLARRWRRRPLLPFLLAATLAVDAALATSVPSSSVPGGLLIGQLGLLAIWTTRSTRGALGRLTLLGCGAGAVLGLVAWQDSNQLDAVLTAITTIVALQAVAAGLVHRAAASWGGKLRPRLRVRFSVLTLLSAMLLVAAGATVLRLGAWSVLLQSGFWPWLAGDMLAPAALLAVSYAAPRSTLLLVGLPLTAFVGVLMTIDPPAIGFAAAYWTALALTIGVWLRGVEVRPRQAEVVPASEADNRKDGAVRTPAREPSPAGESNGPAILPMRLDVRV